MTRCLLVDDDLPLAALLADYLTGFGFKVETVHTGAAMRERFGRGGIDVLLLDLMLPDDDGLNLCQWAKRKEPAMPVLMLTAQGDPMSRVLGLELGADDYLPKPFEPRELVARIKAVLRRGTGASAEHRAAVKAQTVRFGGWSFDRLRRQLIAADETVVALSAAEYRMLAAFVDHPGRVLSRERLLDLSRAPGTEVSDRAVDLAVSRLRTKLGDTGRDPHLIRTLRGEGYLFDAVIES